MADLLCPESSRAAAHPENQKQVEVTGIAVSSLGPASTGIPQVWHVHSYIGPS